MESSNKMRVLNVLSSLDGGGVEMMLYNYYSNMDHSRIRFDFVTHSPKQGMLEAPLRVMGCNIYHVTPKHTSIFRNIIEIDRIIKNNNYDIVQCHQNFLSFTTLICARLRGVKVRIVHAHGCKQNESFITKTSNILLRKMNRIGANYNFACGNNAGKWLFGKNWLTGNHYKIINNAIDTVSFRFDPVVRKRMRSEYNAVEHTVLLHVGRFSTEKNHIYLIKIMSLLNRKCPGKYVLFLVGSGPLETEIRELVNAMNLENAIYFMGNRENISDFMSMADIFLLPSFHEGFPVTLVEAQASGLQVIVSKSISKETRLTNNIKYLQNNSPSYWVKIILENKSTNYDRKKYSRIINEGGFDVEYQSKQYEKLLSELIGGSS
jgi:glycosyltransferase involved in cell wall biosynthesis